MPNTYNVNEIEQKFRMLESHLDRKYENLESKLNNIYTKSEIDMMSELRVQRILSETRNILLEQQMKERAEREADRRITKRWIIGLAVTIILFFLKELIFCTYK
ncbi:hypothetical protein [Streptococcus acidominimus]|uniref:Uncharacterized protein n=1 Tax=Streptococcus acidominimus TaxID=1326 RepID=A0A1Q8EDW0_STRAI|nr:hypothetical protein [Streptococcus acidominimus]OLF49968.1 hypothetical protein BU200_04475 [Streptococcus acidominimus]SUN04914.1 Uncharacterised protein [Streptococcus acidominimus]